MNTRFRSRTGKWPKRFWTEYACGGSVERGTNCRPGQSSRSENLDYQQLRLRQARFARSDDGLRPVRDLELAADIRNVIANGLEAQHQHFGDRFIR